MRNNLKCPFCQQELCQDYTGVMYCCNDDCEQSADWYGSPILWQELAQAKQDLDIARKALDKADRFFEGTIGLYQSEMMAIIKTALEQIKHKDEQ